jgi:hypothetical protein
MILQHPVHPLDSNWAILADFGSGKHQLLPDHIRWLNTMAGPALVNGNWVCMRGMASRLGSVQSNQILSEQRANEVAKHLRSFPRARVDHITLVRGSGENLSSGGPQDDGAAWRSVEVIITPNRQLTLPRITTLPLIRIEGQRPPRFSISVVRSMSVGPITTIEFLIRDSRRGKEARFKVDMLGLSQAPVNIGSRGGWSTIPDDAQITQLHDFHRAQVDMISGDFQRPGPGGRQIGFSFCVLVIHLSNTRANRIRISRFDAGSSMLPDAGTSTGDMVHFPNAEFEIGTF